MTHEERARKWLDSISDYDTLSWQSTLAAAFAALQEEIEKERASKRMVICWCGHRNEDLCIHVVHPDVSR